LVFVIAVPLLALLGRSGISDVLIAARSDEVSSAVGVSLRTSLVSLAVLLFIGTPTAFLIARNANWLTSLFGGLLLFPALLPPSVAGIALLLAFGRHGVLGPLLSTLGIPFSFSPLAVVTAQVFVACPFFIRPMIEGFRSIDQSQLDAGSMDGGDPFWISVPLARPALMSAITGSWARALGEFGATILVAGSRLGVTRTMPMAIYLGFETDLNEAVALSVILLGLAAFVLGVGATMRAIWER
jgi:molybdate transport system permease protein